MRVQLVFSVWLGKDGKPLPQYSEKGTVADSVRCYELILSDFHAGTTFQTKIELDEDATADLRAALAEGYRPVFYAVAVDPDDWRAAANKSQ